MVFDFYYGSCQVGIYFDRPRRLSDQPGLAWVTGTPCQGLLVFETDKIPDLSLSLLPGQKLFYALTMTTLPNAIRNKLLLITRPNTKTLKNISVSMEIFSERRNQSILISGLLVWPTTGAMHSLQDHGSINHATDYTMDHRLSK